MLVCYVTFCKHISFFRKCRDDTGTITFFFYLSLWCQVDILAQVLSKSRNKTAFPFHLPKTLTAWRQCSLAGPQHQLWRAKSSAAPAHKTYKTQCFVQVTPLPDCACTRAQPMKRLLKNKEEIPPNLAVIGDFNGVICQHFRIITTIVAIMSAVYVQVVYTQAQS